MTLDLIAVANEPAVLGRTTPGRHGPVSATGTRRRDPTLLDIHVPVRAQQAPGSWFHATAGVSRCSVLLRSPPRSPRSPDSSGNGKCWARRGTGSRVFEPRPSPRRRRGSCLAASRTHAGRPVDRGARETAGHPRGPLSPVAPQSTRARPPRIVARLAGTRWNRRRSAQTSPKKMPLRGGANHRGDVNDRVRYPISSPAPDTRPAAAPARWAPSRCSR